MNRRLKNRIPLSLWGSARKLPHLVMVVTTSLVIAPKAWARIQGGDAEVRFVTQTYTKDQLKSTAPANPNLSVSERIANEMVGIINSIANNMRDIKRQERLNQIKTQTPGSDAMLAMASEMKDAPTTRHVDLDGLRSFMGLEIQKVGREDIKKNFTGWNKLIDAAKFDLKLGNLWAGSNTPPPNTDPSGNVRYALVVRDIVPNADSPRMASVNDTLNEMAYAGHADVKWTIGPVTEAHSKIFDGVTPETVPGNSDGSIGVKTPTANFHTNLTPEGADDITKLTTAALPNMKFELIQDDGFYTMTYRTSAQGQRLGIEHNVKVPVAGTVALGRRFADNFKVVETSAYNILYDKRMPMLSVHRMNIEQRFTADMSIALKDNQKVGMGARGKAAGVVANEVDRPEAYNVNYTRDL